MATLNLPIEAQFPTTEAAFLIIVPNGGGIAIHGDADGINPENSLGGTGVKGTGRGKGTGVFGTGGAVGVVGVGNDIGATGVLGSGDPGVSGESDGGTAVLGKSKSGVGVAEGFLGGKNPFVDQPLGVFGRSDHTGVVGIANKANGSGVYGGSTGGIAIGVMGESGDAHGVFGKNNSALNTRDAPGGPMDLNIKAAVWGDNLGGGYGVRGTSIGPLGTVGVHGHGTDSGVEGFGAA